jgi:ATP-dependent protease ClpP protease subunit
MSKFPFRVIRNEASSEANIFLYGIVGDYWYSDNPVTARSLQRQLTLLSDYKRINLRLNGPGGDVHEGLLILNTILADKGSRIHTYNDGVCLSMMAVLLESVPAERRHAAKASLTMIHSASTYAWGNASDMRDTADMLDKHDDVLAGVFADALDLTIDQVKAKWFNDGKDHWLTATEGAAEGLFSVEDYDISEIPENPIDKSLDQIAAFYSRPIANNSQSKITNNTDMGLLSNKFKTIAALGKIPVAERTAEHIKAVNDELEAEGITGATLVSDTDLQETVTEAEKVPALTIEAAKVPALETQVTALTTEKVTLSQEVTALKATVAAQAIELGKPAEEATPPATTLTDSTGGKTVVDSFETSFDREAARFTK